MKMTPKEKLQSFIEEGRRNVPVVLSRIKSEMENRKDMIAKPAFITYEVDADGVRPVINNNPLKLTQFSEGQLYQRTEVPQAFANKLIKLGEYDLLKDNLSTMTEKLNKNGILFRTVDDTTKGILSPSYRRMDAAPVFESFVNQSIQTGYVPYRGFNTSYRYQLSFIWPQLFEVTPNEHVLYGINITTSDYGAGALALEMSIMRVICTNLAIGFDMIRKVHIGKRFDMGDKDFVDLDLSEKTHALDSDTVASAISDVVKQSEVKLQLLNDIVVKGVSKDVDVKSVVASLRKGGVRKEIADQIETTYDTQIGVEFLPQQKGAWRLSNTISLIAGAVGKSGDSDMQIDLERKAMEVLAG
jgi:hypothetical protein